MKLFRRTKSEQLNLDLYYRKNNMYEVSKWSYINV